MKRAGGRRRGLGRFRAVLSLLLAALTVLSVLPVDAFAAENVPGTDGTVSADWIEQSDEALIDEDHITVPIKNKANRAANGAAQDMVECTWFFDNDDVEITWDGDIAQWHMEKTDMRYVEMAIRVNIGTNVAAGAGDEGLEAGTVKVILPYYLPTGRVKNDAQVRPVWTSPVGDDASGLSISVNEASNEVVVTNRVSIAAGTHKSVVIFYKADCWNIVSGENFDVGYTWEGVNGAGGTGCLRGRVFTGFDIRGISSNVGSRSEYVTSRQSYAHAYASGYESYYGLTKEEFDQSTGGDDAADPDYVYDIWQVSVSPKGQQPYKIEGTFVPGSYPSKADTTYSNRKPYGWEGELVGMSFVLSSSTSTSHWSVDCVEQKGVSYDDLPNSGSNGKNNSYVDEAKKHVWNKYDFSFDASKLSYAVSNFSDVSSTWTNYYLYFLVKYPVKDVDGDGVVSVSQGSGKIELDGTVSVSHDGIDSTEPVTRFLCDQLYSGGIYKKPVKPVGKIYDDAVTCTERIFAGVNSLIDYDEKVEISSSATYYCYNERRAVSPAETGEYYTLEGFVNCPTLGGRSGSSWEIPFNEGDYRITSFYLSNAHDYSEASGTDKTAPDWAKDEQIHVYGSTEMSGNADWEELASYNLYDIWEMKSSVTSIPDDTGILRLKVVYPGSRLAARFTINYSMDILPGRESVRNEALDVKPGGQLHVYQNIDYKAYLKSDYEKYYPDGPITPDLKTLTASDSTMLTRIGGDEVGLLVGQFLYDQSGKLIGTDTWKKTSTTAALQTEATNIGKIVYSIDGFVMLPASNNFSGAITRMHELCIDKGIVSPYTSKTQRYYALLPRGMKYLENSISVGTDRNLSGGRSGNRAGHISLSDSAARALDTYSNLISMYWSPTGASVEVTSKWIGDRQLLIIDRSMGPSTYPTELTYGSWNESYYAWGAGVSFTVVPANENINLQSGNYETLFMHQFITGDLNTAFSLDGYGGNIYASTSDLYKGSEARTIDSYVMSLGESTLTTVRTAFRNRTGSEGSYAMVQVKDGDISYNNGEYGLSALTDLTTEDADSYYTYSLTYTVDSGNSKDVVLWDNIEVYDRGGNAPDWTGTQVGIDTNETGAVAYVNTESISIDDYVNAGADHTWLTDGARGWTEADENTDWSAVRSVAFWFKDKTFDSKEQLGPKTATVYLKMLAPEKISTNAEQNTYLTYNEIGFTDWHSTLQATATVLSNSVDVGIYIENPEPEAGGFELPRTGGMGTGAFAMTGVPMALCAGLLLAARRRRRQ